MCFSIFSAWTSLGREEALRGSPEGVGTSRGAGAREWNAEDAEKHGVSTA